MRYLVALTVSLGLHAIALAAEKKSAADAYVQRIGAIVNRLADSEISEHPERLNANGFSVKLRYHVHPSGRVQRIDIISAKPDRSAANAIAHRIKSTAFPPFPKDLLQQGLASIQGELDWTWIPQKPKADRRLTYIQVASHPEPHSCVLAIAAIDGKPLPSPQKQVTLSPGRHNLSIRVWLGDANNKVVHADASLDQNFKPHHYWIDGEMRKGGLFKLIVEDEDERPRGVKRQKTK